MALTATILDIQRMSTEDGPGMRTTVFFKGCNLACAWCHNPESIGIKKQVLWNEVRCIGCRLCLDACATGALRMGEKGMEIEKDVCANCLKCTEACPTGALEVKGTTWDVDALVHEVLKDEAYFGDKGGVTLSGGEVLLQHQFAEEMLRALKNRHIHTAVDTAGNVSKDILQRILPHTDLLLYDIKLIDPVLHQKYTDSRNERILSNIEYVAQTMRNTGTPGQLWIRTPVIPGATDSEENIRAIAEFIAEKLGDVVERWELCAFNNLCKNKYKTMGKDWAFVNTQLIKKEDLERLTQTALSAGLHPAMVYATGSTRIEE